MGTLIFRKPASYTDVKYHFVIVPKEMFQPDSTVTLLVKGQRKSVYVDSRLRLKLGARIFEDLGIDKIGDVLVLEQIESNVFRVTKEAKSIDMEPRPF